MEPLLSICIPSLNRCCYLIDAIKSIVVHGALCQEIEICISNNASDEDYSDVERLIEGYSNSWSIKYVKHANRLSLDENMQYVSSMAKGDYILYLGDDDLLLPEDAEKLLKLLKCREYDLLVFESIVIDSTGLEVGGGSVRDYCEYRSAFEAFKDLGSKCSFGSLVVKRMNIDLIEFKKYFGSSHAYGLTYWVKLLNQTEDCLIAVPDFSCTAIRAAEKNYSLIRVWYRDVPFGFSLYQKYLSNPKHRVYMHSILNKAQRMHTSLRFILSEMYHGATHDDFYAENPVWVRTLRFRVNFLIALVLMNSGLFSYMIGCRKILRSRAGGK